MFKNRGFTLVELVMTIVIIGIISAVAVPRMFDTNLFETRGFADQVQASLRYAQKVAIAQNRFVCAAFTASSVTLSIGATSACGTPLQSPTGEASYVINAPSGVTFTTSPAAFNFNPLGQPSIATSGVVGTYTITVEAQTGYVH